MQYNIFGNIGIRISALGFGAMRLPLEKKKGKNCVKEEESVQIIHRAFELGVNYIDTAYSYYNGQSEIVVGKAVKEWKDKIYVSTKMPTWLVKDRKDYRRFLEEQLKRLDVDYIDFYHFHDLNRKRVNDIVKKFSLLDEAQQAKNEGLIKHISFSFHDKPEVMKDLIDTRVFETVLCQYNLLDTSNEDAIAYAHRKGLGVAIMGPVGGGRLGFPTEVIQNLIPDGVKTTPEIALRFVLSNRNVHCALSGMSTIKMVEENAAVASKGTLLTDEEKQQINLAMEENRKLTDLYCTGCNYCMPCPNEVNIPINFQLMNYHRVYKLTEYARREYKKIGKVDWMKGKRADECDECGVCEEKCPQNIEIRKQLKETAKALK